MSSQSQPQSQPQAQPKLVIISEYLPPSSASHLSEQAQGSSDPLQQQILSMKLTSNLLKQISFNSTVNKFDYFEKLLHQQNTKFNKKVGVCQQNQKELVKKIKNVQKSVKDIRNQSNAINYAKLHVQLQELRGTKQEAEKYKKLSQGMVKYLEKINERLDQL